MEVRQEALPKEFRPDGVPSFLGSDDEVTPTYGRSRQTLYYSNIETRMSSSKQFCGHTADAVPAVWTSQRRQPK